MCSPPPNLTHWFCFLLYFLGYFFAFFCYTCKNSFFFVIPAFGYTLIFSKMFVIPLFVILAICWLYLRLLYLRYNQRPYWNLPKKFPSCFRSIGWDTFPIGDTCKSLFIYYLKYLQNIPRYPQLSPTKNQYVATHQPPHSSTHAPK